MILTHAITLWPEWAWAVCHLGRDVVPLPERALRSVLDTVGSRPVAVYASAHEPHGQRVRVCRMHALITRADRAGWRMTTDPHNGNREFRHQDSRHATVMSYEGPPVGAIVAVARVRRGTTYSPWANPGLASLELVAVQVLPVPVFIMQPHPERVWYLPEQADIAVSQVLEGGGRR